MCRCGSCDVTSLVRLPPRSLACLGACVVVTLLASVTACGSSPTDQPEPLYGADLVAGTSLERHGLLVIPKQTGVAEFRSIEDPSTTRWTGRLILPATTAAHGLGRTVVLRHQGGASLYTPSPESLTPLPNVPPQARWISSSSGGAFVAGGWALTVTSSTSRVIRADGEILWAAPIPDDRAVGLIDSPLGPKLGVWEPEEEIPSNTRPVNTQGPVILTGWGNEVVGTSADGTRLIRWSIPDLESVEVLKIENTITALATSPSQHRIYAATATSPELLTVDRYEWKVVGTVRHDERIEFLRISKTDDRILAYDGTTVWSMRASETNKVAIPSQWRSDFPVFLLDGSTLVLDSAGLGVYGVDGSYMKAVDGPLSAWWIPVHWGSRAPVTAVASTPEDTLGQLELSPMSTRKIGLLTMGSAAGRASALRRRDAAVLPDRRVAPNSPTTLDTQVRSLLSSGFYVVVNSSRQLSSLEGLEEALEGSGYSTHVVPHVDEVSDMWYRLLVGPYILRASADTVNSKLRRERGIDAWIQEIDRQR
jgi:hypothetical protein